MNSTALWTAVTVAVIVIAGAIMMTGNGTNSVKTEPSPGEAEGVGHGSSVVLHYFWAAGCPFCAQQTAFLNEVIAIQYPEVEIKRYNIADRSVHPVLTELARQYGAERYMGGVPVTFVGDRFFTGFDSADGIGAQIIAEIEQQLTVSSKGLDDENGV